MNSAKEEQQIDSYQNEPYSCKNQSDQMKQISQNIYDRKRRLIQQVRQDSDNSILKNVADGIHVDMMLMSNNERMMKIVGPFTITNLPQPQHVQPAPVSQISNEQVSMNAPDPN